MISERARDFFAANPAAQSARSGLAAAAKAQTSLPSKSVPARALPAKTVQAVRHADLLNTVQGAVGKLATSAISIAAPFLGSFAADAFGRVLPKSMPPVLREAAKLAVSMAVTKAVAVAAPFVGAAVGAVAAVAVASVVKVIAIVVAIFAVPKPLIFLLAFLCVAALFQYWRCRRHRRLRDPALMEATS